MAIIIDDAMLAYLGAGSVGAVIGAILAHFKWPIVYVETSTSPEKRTEQISKEMSSWITKVKPIIVKEMNLNEQQQEKFDKLIGTAEFISSTVEMLESVPIVGRKLRRWLR